MSEMPIRSYRDSDHAALLAAFDSNVPEYFGKAERAELLADLEGGNGTYFVADKGGIAVACGGYTIAGDALSLIWGLVHRAEHGHGFGTRLLEHRLNVARTTAGIRTVLVSTSQKSAGFYARFGFVERERFPFYYGPGVDRIDMALVLT